MAGKRTAAREVGHFIGGAPSRGESGRTGEVFDPATGKVQARVAFANRAEVGRVVAAAREAFPAWAATPPLTRGRVLFRFRDLLSGNLDRLAAIITSEQGKTITDARGEMIRGMEVVEFATGIPHLLKGGSTPGIGRGIDSFSTREPVGVCVGITPFNFPAMVPLWMFPIAIACGNTFILKPSERDPSVALELATLLTEAGLPDGVFNVVNGDREAVDALTDSPSVAAISFVGSTGVAEAIHARGCAAAKRVQALGGAKNHAVVMPDADPDHVADALMGAAYGSAGERCMAISVAVAVGERKADELIERLVPRVRGLKIGRGTDEGIEMGPLITSSHRDRVAAFIESGVEEGAGLLVDGRERSDPAWGEGFFLGASLFDRVTPAMRIWREEIFGPVLCVVRVANLREAIDLINSHALANGTAIFTRDGAAAQVFCRKIQVGMVGVNVPIPVPMAFHSFGGWKRSMFGDHAMHGPEGIRFFTRLKTVTARWPDAPQSGPEFTMPTVS